MNRNLKTLLVVFAVLLVAALMGCGGGANGPGDPVSPDQDAQAEPDAQPDTNPQPDADSQPEADAATQDSDAGTDVQQPDADAAPEADQSDATDASNSDSEAAAEAEASADDADAQAEADPPDVQPEADAADASDSDATQVETCVPPLPGDSCAVCGAWSCDNSWRCSTLGVWDNPSKPLYNCADAGDACTPPALGADCAMPGDMLCTRECDCAFKWNDPANTAAFYCLQDAGAEADAQDAGEDAADVAEDTQDAQPEAEAGSCPGECSPGWTLACDTSCGASGNMAGLKHCGNDCKWGACVPPSETCNGQDDDCDGQKDNGFACAQNQPYACHTQCDPVGQDTGTATCNATCQYLGACQVPQENCSNGRDDDCDGKDDCADEDCWGAVACPHNFNDCDVIPNGTGITCDDPVKDTIPRFVDPQFGPNQYMVGISSGCANAIGDQWAVGLYIAKDESRIIHLTSGNTWSYVDVPFATCGSMGWGNVACQGTNQTFFALNKPINKAQKHYNTVLSVWNGSQITVLGEITDFMVSAMWAASPDHIVLTATNGWLYPGETRVYTWNGTGFSYVSAKLYAPDDFLPENIWGSSPSDVYIVGSHRDANQNFYPAFAHWDGTSWTKIQIPSQITSLGNISGTSACDVMAVGGSTGPGFTLQRNGNTWQPATYSNLDSIVGVSKFTAQQYVLTGSKNLPMFLGTSNGDWTSNWRQVDGIVNSPSATWIASTSPKVVMMADAYVNEAKIHRSTCQ